MPDAVRYEANSMKPVKPAPMDANDGRARYAGLEPMAYALRFGDRVRLDCFPPIGRRMVPRAIEPIVHVGAVSPSDQNRRRG